MTKVTAVKDLLKQNFKAHGQANQRLKTVPMMVFIFDAKKVQGNILN
jgi:hypothetical protein